MSLQLTDKDVTDYIKDNPVMVLGTANEQGKPHGAAVYVCAPTAETVYFVTKSETLKFKNIVHNPHVSVTIVNTADNSSLQAAGHAKVINDPSTIESVMGHMAKIYATSADWLPPIAKLRAGPYQVVGVKLEHTRLAHFQHAKPGSPVIFEED